MTSRTAALAAGRPAISARTRAIDLRIGGTLLVLAGSTILMGIITAEALYPGAFSTGGNEISDLGGTRPPDSVVLQPSAAIFDLSMVAIGLLIMSASWFVQGALGRRSVTIPIAVLGFGALGVGLFPGNTGTPHALFAMTTFVAGGVAAVSAGRVATGPFRMLSVLLGATALVTLGLYVLLGDASPMARLGIGGVERWIVYPIVLWVVAFGGYLSGRAEGEPLA
jgi:hypothetical membrane protein